MPTTAEVLIIGAGIVGASTAYHLAAKGVKDIIVVEKENVASGATGRSSAMLTPGTGRVPGRADLAWKSVQIYQKFQNEMGIDCGFRPDWGPRALWHRSRGPRIRSRGY